MANEFANWEEWDVVDVTDTQETNEGDAPVDEFANWEEWSTTTVYDEEYPVMESDQTSVEENLPTTLQVDPLAILEPLGIDVMDPIDTGVSFKEAAEDVKSWHPMARMADYVLDKMGVEVEAPESKEIGAMLTGWGAGMMDVSRGVKQLLDIDVEEEKRNEEILKNLTQDAEYGMYATLGEMGGMITDPMGFLLPMTKAQTTGRALVYGATTGGVFGFAGYVDTESGEDRLVNAATGTFLGGAFTYGLNKFGKVLSNREQSKAIKQVRTLEAEWARVMRETGDELLTTTILKQSYPELVEEGLSAGQKIGVEPTFAIDKEEAGKLLTYYGGDLKNPPSGLIDKVAGVVSTRIKNISPVVANNLNRLEYNLHRRPEELRPIVEGFAEMYKGLNKDAQHVVNKALINGDFDVASDEIRRFAGDAGVEVFEEATGIFNKLGGELKELGVIEDTIENYWHRHVTNVEGLLEDLGTPKDTTKTIAMEIAAKNKEVRKARGYEMTPHEEAVFVQGKLRNNKQLEKVGYASERGLEKVEEKLLKHYSDPVVSLQSYIYNAVNDIEIAKFLGPDNLRMRGKKADGKGSDEFLFDPKGSIEAWAENFEEIKDLDRMQLYELKELLRARFGAGQQPMNEVLKGMKTFMYSALLGNPIAAMTQLGDVGAAAYRNGVMDTSKALVRTVLGATDIKTKDLGLGDRLVQEFSEANKGSKKLEWFLKASGFDAVDRMGKSVLINGSLDKYARGVTDTSSKEFKRLSNKYGEAWGAEFHDLVSDLRTYQADRKPENITDNIRFLVWSELSEMQPISLSEMPQKYLEMPNGKVVYMLKSFMLKQFDILRRDGIQKIKQGDIAEGIANITKYSMLMGGGAMGADKLKDLALGKENADDPDNGIESLPGEFVSNIFKTFGISEFMIKNIKEGNIDDAVAQVVLPPLNILGDIFIKSWSKSIKQDEKGDIEFDPEGLKPEKITRYIPIAGRIATERFLDGKDEKKYSPLDQFGD